MASNKLLAKNCVAAVLAIKQDHDELWAVVYDRVFDPGYCAAKPHRRTLSDVNQKGGWKT